MTRGKRLTRNFLFKFNTRYFKLFHSERSIWDAFREMESRAKLLSYKYLVVFQGIRFAFTRSYKKLLSHINSVSNFAKNLTKKNIAKKWCNIEQKGGICWSIQ